MLYYESRAVTDIGNRRETNQDSHAEITEYINNKYVGLYCVADGMGGLRDGEYASRLAVTKTLQWYKDNISLMQKKTISEKKLKKSLKALFYDINAAIYNYGQKNGISVGTTYSLLWLADNRYLVIHAGDSRIYLKRGNSLYLLTKDQTWINEQLEHGFISAEQAKNHPKKNVLANCIGCFEIPSICTGEGEVMQNDKFLLCSDGLYNFLSIDEISAGMMNSDMNIGINMMLDLVKQRGAYDNITVSLVSVMGECGQESVTEGFV